jgi:hypothetical protein
MRHFQSAGLYAHDFEIGHRGRAPRFLGGRHFRVGGAQDRDGPAQFVIHALLLNYARPRTRGNGQSHRKKLKIYRARALSCPPVNFTARERGLKDMDERWRVLACALPAIGNFRYDSSIEARADVPKG